MLLFGCLIAVVIAFAPRLMLILAWIFSDRWQIVWQNEWVMPLLGIIFLPFTTIMYMLTWTFTGGIEGWDWMWILLGFVLDFIEITFVVVPIVGPVLLTMGLDPVWLGIMIAINLQTSFLTPPFGFALFYLRGVAPESIRTADIYRGVTPFIAIQLGMLGLLALWPALATWLPGIIYR